MKGQIFIMTAVLVLIALILLKNTIKPITVKPENSLSENFLNLKNELMRAIDISILNNEGVASNLNSFVTFSSNVLKQRGYTETVEYSISTYYNTTTVYLNLSLTIENSFIEDSFIINRTVYT